jgi:hypothetical protein
VSCRLWPADFSMAFPPPRRAPALYSHGTTRPFPKTPGISVTPQLLRWTRLSTAPVRSLRAVTCGKSLQIERFCDRGLVTCGQDSSPVLSAFFPQVTPSLVVVGHGRTETSAVRLRGLERIRTGKCPSGTVPFLIQASRTLAQAMLLSPDLSCRRDRCRRLRALESWSTGMDARRSL